MATRGFEGVTRADITQRELRQKGTTVPSARSKYRNVKTVIGDEKFDSKREAAYWLGLLARRAAGEIHSLYRQVPFALCAPDRTGRNQQNVIVAMYVADFSYYDRADMRHVVDAKGKRTQMYALKKKWLELQDGIVIEEV